MPITSSRLSPRWRASHSLPCSFHVAHTRQLATVAKTSSAATSSLRQHSSNAIQLRPYQEESVRAVLDYLHRGEKRLGISLATGSGKTVIFSHLIDRVPAPCPEATQTLILAHRQELVEQAAKHCQDLYPDRTVEIEMAKKHASGYADITAASVATLRSPERLLRLNPSRFKLILVDEAHHIVANSYMDILRHFNLSSKQERGHTALVGVSATFSRHDGLALGAAIDHIVYHKDYVDMIEDDWLASAIFTTVRTNVDLSRVKTSGADFQTGSLSKAVNNDSTNAIAVRTWLEKGGCRNSTLVFCVDLAHVASLTAMFRQHGIDAHFVTGNTHPKDRREKLDAFKVGAFPVLLNCGIFTEGTDIPNIDCVLLARPTKSRNLLVQMIGRGLRKFKDKKDCHIIDMVASLEAGIVTAPTLFGLDPDELVQAADFKHMKSLRERREIEKQQAEQAVEASDNINVELKGDVIFTDYDNVHDLIQDTSGERHIRAISRNAWVQIDDNRYILSNRDGAHITLNHDGSFYRLSYTPRLPAGAKSSAPFAKTRAIGKMLAFGDAVRAGDKFASDKFPHDFVTTSAYWRKAAATPGQIEFLNSFRDKDQKLDVGAITKGKAADWITKIKHGARGRFNRMQGQKRKADKQIEKRRQWHERQRNEMISVGPVKKRVSDGEVLV